MATIWQKTLFYLGLVDDEATEANTDPNTAPVQAPPPQAQVRTVSPQRHQQTPRQQSSAQPPPQTQPQPYEPQPYQSQPYQPQRASGVAGRRIEPPSASRRRISSEPQHAEAGVIIRPGGEAAGRPLSASAARGRGGEAEIIVARTFSDAQLLADHIKANRPVVIDLRNAEAAMVRRLVDFASGLTYGLGGKMIKTAQGVILVTPTGVNVGIEERRRLAALDLYAPVAEG